MLLLRPTNHGASAVIGSRRQQRKGIRTSPPPSTPRRAIGQVAFVNYTNIHNSIHGQDDSEGRTAQRTGRPNLYYKRLQESFFKWMALEYARELLGEGADRINLAWTAATVCHVVSVRNAWTPARPVFSGSHPLDARRAQDNTRAQAPFERCQCCWCVRCR